MNGRHLTLFTLLTVAACLPAAWSPADEPPKAEKPAADSMLGNEAGDVRDDNALKMKLVWCPPGAVRLEHLQTSEAADGTLTSTIHTGSALLRGYWLGRHEVTQPEWKEIMQTEPWKGIRTVREGVDFPATCVSWEDAMAYCRKLSEAEREGGRLSEGWEYTLPTLAQWERACRARTETLFSFGDDESKLGDFAWYRENAINAGEDYAHRVGQKKPNRWGIYDLYGNVWEWCRDFYDIVPPSGRDPEVTAEHAYRAARGGSFRGIAYYCRHSTFTGQEPTRTDVQHGFRVALSPVQPVK